MARFSMDTATDFLFGRDIASLDESLPYPPSCPQPLSESEHNSRSFVDAFTKALDITSRRRPRGPHWRLFEAFTDKAKGYRRIIDVNMDDLFGEERTNKVDDGSLMAALAGNFDGQLLFTVSTSYYPRSLALEKIVRDELISILFAGRDTVRLTDPT